MTDLKQQVLDKCISSRKKSKFKTWKEFKSEYNAKHFTVKFPELVCKEALRLSQAEVEKAISSIEQTKSMAWRCPEDRDEFEDALAFLRKRLLARSETKTK